MVPTLKHFTIKFSQITLFREMFTNKQHKSNIKSYVYIKIVLFIEGIPKNTSIIYFLMSSSTRISLLAKIHNPLSIYEKILLSIHHTHFSRSLFD